MASVSVLLVDDQAPFLRAANAVVAATPGFAVIGEARSGEQAVDMAAALRPQVVLMDINMDGIGGIEATRRIMSLDAATVVLLVSTYSEADLPADARACGAAGYVHKEKLDPDVLEATWAAAAHRA